MCIPFIYECSFLFISLNLFSLIIYLHLQCVENISRSHCPVCLGDIHTSRIPCHIPDCGHLLHKTCFDQLLNSGHYTCPICQTSLIDMTALWEYLDAQAVSLPVPKKYENQRIHIFCNDCHKVCMGYGLPLYAEICEKYLL